MRQKYFAFLTSHNPKPTSHSAKSKTLRWVMVLGLLMFGVADMQAQTVVVTGTCNPGVFDGTYTPTTAINGRPAFQRTIPVTNGIFIAWSTANNQWELTNGMPPTTAIGYVNTANTPNPPAASAQAWGAGFCSTAISVSGTGTWSPAPPADVPTLSEWGLIVLALLFMTFGTLYILQGQKRLEAREIE